MFEGININLRKANTSDVPKMAQWGQRADFHFFICDYSNTPEEQIKKQILSQITRQGKYPTHLSLIIETKDGFPVGLVLFNDINWKDKNLSMETIIGEDAYRGKQYGADAFLTGADFAFSILNMHKVYGYVFEYNEKSIQLCEWAGEKREAILKHHMQINGKFHSAFIYGILDRDFCSVKAAISQQIKVRQ